MEFKQAVTTGGGVKLVPRASTKTTLSDLGLTKKNAEDILLSLSVVDYSKGPESDRDRSGNVWFFGKEVNGHELYIKLKVAEVKGVKLAKCISFHVAEHAIRYPLK